MSSDAVEEIKNYYENPNNAVYLPFKKVVKADLKEKMILNKMTEELHKDFLQKKHVKINLSTFRKLRPANVLTVGKAKFEQCLCELCTNVELKLEVLNSAARKENLAELIIKNRYHCAELTECSKAPGATFAHKNCISRDCKKCGVKLLRKKLEPLFLIYSCKTCLNNFSDAGGITLLCERRPP